MCYTFSYKAKLKADMLTDGLVFQLDPKLSYRIIIHDPNYLLMASNPLVFPRIWQDYKAQDLQPGKFEWLYISLTEHRLLNRDDQPCDENPDYSYIACVKNSQARRVGCRPGWEDWSDPDIPICVTMEQLAEHESLDWGNYNYEPKIIENMTNCKVPCTYKEFAVVGEPQGGSATIFGSPEYFTFGFNFACTDITIKKEVWVYPLLSFVAELGGSLGLFLGVSFLSLWDLWDVTYKYIKE